MYRYVAFAWNHENPRATQEVRRLRRELETRLPEIRNVLGAQGLVVYCASDSPASCDVYPARGEPAVVVGKLFHREMNEVELPKRVELDETTTRAVMQSQGRCLLDRFWGGYVAFIHDEARRSTFVVRDPSGDMPCFVTSVDEVSVVFSCTEDCIALGFRRFSMNLQYATAFLVRPYFDVRETGLNEVSLVAPGECLELRAGVEHQRHYYWNIVDIAADNPIEELKDAVQAARKTVLACIGAIGADHPQLTLRLSGGLDSSIMLAGLMRAPSQPDVTCLHYFDDHAGADERPFARLAVEGASATSGRACKLLEYRRIPTSLDFEQLARFPRTACPNRYVAYLTTHCIGPVTTGDGHGAFFSGSGGDGTFVRLRDASAVNDYVWRHGLGRHLPRIALESAQFGGTFYGVLARAIRNGMFARDRTLDLGKLHHMIDPAAFEAIHADADRFVPAWKKAVAAPSTRLSPEKLMHIESMSVSWRTMDPFERVRGREWFAPFTAQPVVELFARMPMYVLMHSAQDRAVARRAFAPYLPAGLLARRTKSYMDDFFLNVTRHNAAFLRETFLDGVLVKERILDRRKVEHTLSRVHVDSDSLVLKLIGPQLVMETWLRNWQRTVQPVARATAA